MSAEGNPTHFTLVGEDPYANFSNEQRMEMFAETGNTSYLTIELARHMKLGVEVMQQIPGVTEEDLVYAQERDVQMYKMYQKPFEEHGLGTKQLENILEQGVPDYLRHLMDAASMPVTENDLDIQEGERNAVVYATLAIEEFLYENEDAVQDLFEAIQLGSSKGIKDVEVVKSIYKRICSEYFYLADKRDSAESMSSEDKKRLKQCEDVLNWYAKMTEDYIENGDGAFSMDNNFLTGLYLYEFCIDSKYTRPNLEPENKDITPYSVRKGDISAMKREINLEKVAENYDRDVLMPFEIEQGRMAVFGVGKNVLYVADKEYSQEHLPITEKLRSEIQYSVVGQGDRQRVFADKSRQLHEEVWDLIDIGQQIGEVQNGESVYSNDEQLRDYLFLMQADMREAIENHFHFSLKDLPIKEQIYFSTFLQDTTFETVHAMRSFVLRYGALGMRTFLALERGDKTLGEKIVAFGENKELAQKVFTYFGELLDSADKAEELAETISHCKLDECRDVSEKIRENLLNRAQKDLERALVAEDVSHVEELVKNYVVHAKEYVALVQEVGAGNIENKKPSELEDNEKEEMRALLRANFEEMYPSDEDAVFRGKVQETLEKSFSNQNTVFKIVRDKEKIVCFSRFDTLADHEGGNVTYAGSFNVRPEYNGLGSVMHDENIKEQLKTGRPIMAHCDPAQPISKKYIESGFVGVGLYPIANKDCFEIWRTDDTVSNYESKQVKREELIAFVGDEKAPFVVREQYVNEAYPEFEEGKVLTRYFVYEGKTYVVFEKAVEPVKKQDSNQEE